MSRAEEPVERAVPASGEERAEGADEWSACATADGSWTLWNTALGEACHSLAGAWEQATQRYALACRLDSFAPAGEARACRLLDVGTGLGLNLAAALWALASRGIALHAVTLERDPRVLERGLALYASLGSGAWEPWHARVRTALRAALAAPGTGVPLGNGVLELRLGDARTTLCAEEKPAATGPFDAVFLDPFSPRRAPELWQEPFLGAVASRMAPCGWLSTYSASFAVRLALGRSGLRVGPGPRVGTKREGTLASPTLAPPPFPERIDRRLGRRGGLSRGP